MSDKKSKLVLGTVQLGMRYGINNVSGQPDNDEAFSILDYAWAHGINTFDTAAAYGSAEEIVGKWIESRKVEGAVHVISKVHVQNNADVRQEIQRSLERLHVEKLDGYLLHSAADMYTDKIVEKMREAKDAGETAHIGVSVYGPREAQDAVRRKFDYVQIPYNVFDRRLDAAHFFEQAAANHVTVFARSPFLQGLLLMEPGKVPAYLSHAVPHLERLRAIAAKYQQTPLQASLGYVQSHAGIDHIVFGVETLEQLKEICAAAQHNVNEDCTNELKEAFIDIDESIVDPSLWKK